MPQPQGPQAAYREQETTQKLQLYCCCNSVTSKLKTAPSQVASSDRDGAETETGRQLSQAQETRPKQVPPGHL